MRIVGGRLGGRRLNPPIGKGTRPTAERVREAIASLLDARAAVAGARILELYAGTGALGFELLSRGASSCVFVEFDPTLATFIKGSATTLALAEQVTVLRADVTRASCQAQVLARGPYTLILSDPPYRDAAKALATLEGLVQHGLLAEGALLLLETSAKSVPAVPPSFQLLSQYRYGDTAVALLAQRTNEPQSAGDPR